MNDDGRPGAGLAPRDADALRRYAMARSSDAGLCAAAALAGLIAACWAMDPLLAVAIFAPAAASEAAERALLRRLAILPVRVLRRPRPRREAAAMAFLNNVVFTLCILALPVVGGVAAAPVAAACALVVSLHAAMVHDAAPRLHVLRQLACATALLGGVALLFAPPPWGPAVAHPPGAPVAAAGVSGAAVFSRPSRTWNAADGPPMESPRPASKSKYERGAAVIPGLRSCAPCASNGTCRHASVTVSPETPAKITHAPRFGSP